MNIEKTTQSLTDKGYSVFNVKTGKEALEKIKTLIPEGATIMNGASVTLEQIGYVDYLNSSEHKWVDLHAKVTAEETHDKRAQLRRESVLSEYYLGSVHALVENGEFIVASNTGSQLPHIVSTSPNLIFVVSTKKIVKSLDDAMERLENHVIPLEDKHMQDLYKMNTQLNKIVVFKGESAMMGRKINFILVEEDLGF